jgi:hypothetical protein|nr:MAG TPA: hypothetical protein [Caudoviricetes sp.]
MNINSDHVLFKVVDDTANVLVIKVGDGGVEDVIYRTLKDLSKKHPNVNRVFFDFIIPIKAQGFKCSRFHMVNIDENDDMVTVYKLSYIHDDELQPVFNPVIENLDFEELNLPKSAIMRVITFKSGTPVFNRVEDTAYTSFVLLRDM